jgi:hypothetical protein
LGGGLICEEVIDNNGLLSNFKYYIILKTINRYL